MKGRYKRAATYCHSCDRAIVAIGKKCSVCGSRMAGPEINKKKTTNEYLNETEED